MGRASTGSKRKYNEKAYDRIIFSVKKGTKQALQEAAAECGESLNGYIKRAVGNQYADEMGMDIKL